MRRATGSGDFLLCLFINIVLNAMWTIPCWILLGLNFAIGVPISWFWASICVFLSLNVIITFVISWAAGAGDGLPSTPPNKNPYSNKNEDMIKRPE